MKVERFTAEWCQPCKSYQPVFDELMERYGIEPIVWDIDTDEGYARSQELKIKSIPTVAVNDSTLADKADLEQLLRIAEV